MKVSNETVKIIQEMALRNSELTQDEVVAVITEREKHPVLKELLEKEYARTATRIISRISVGSEERTVFAIRGKDGSPTTYVNIRLSTDKEKLALIVRRLENQKKGLQRSIDNAKRRQKVLDGQISLEEYYASLDATVNIANFG